MPEEDTNTISVDELMAIIGKKQIQVELLNGALAKMSKELAQCQKELETLNKNTSKKDP